MYKCPCGFTTVQKCVMELHIKGCYKAKQSLKESNNDIIDDLFSVATGVVIGSIISDLFDSSSSSTDSSDSFSGGGDFGGGGSSSDW